MPTWGSWLLFFAVSACSLVLARWLDREPKLPTGPSDSGTRASVPGAAPGTPLPPALAGAPPEPLSVEVPLGR